MRGGAGSKECVGRNFASIYGSAVGAAIAEALRSEHCKLTSLNLRSNGLDAEDKSGLKMLFPWVEL